MEYDTTQVKKILLKRVQMQDKHCGVLVLDYENVMLPVAPW